MLSPHHFHSKFSIARIIVIERALLMLLKLMVQAILSPVC